MVGIKEITLHLCLDHSPSVKLRLLCYKHTRKCPQADLKEKREGGHRRLKGETECSVMKKLATFTVQLRLNDDWQEKGSARREMERGRHNTS